MEAALSSFSTYDLHRATVCQIAIYTGVPAARLAIEFGDETQIFGAVLTWYFDEGFVAWLHRLHRICDPVEAISRLFHSISEQPGSTQTNEVGLLFVTAMNLAPGSPIFERIVRNAMHKLEHSSASVSLKALARVRSLRTELRRYSEATLGLRRCSVRSGMHG